MINQKRSFIEKVKTIPDFSENSINHCLAKHNNDHQSSWLYNVVDKFKNLSVEEIKSELKSTTFPYAVCMENWVSDFNFGSLIRNANAFNAESIYYVGNRKYDRRGTVGVHNYSDVKWIPSLEELLKLKEKYIFIGVDNIDGAISINDYQWKTNSMMIFGSEGVGLTPMMQSLCQEFVYIKQYGSVRSLNAATASGIIMNDFVSKFIKN